MKRIPYASAIGSIMYAMLCTRIDVSCALSTCSRYQSDPGERHWMAVKNILKYLKRTKDMFLVYGGEDELTVRGYSDASFQTDKDDYRSQSGFVFCLNGGAVSWKSSKQSTVADSTMEAEYIALSDAAKEGRMVRKGWGVTGELSNEIQQFYKQGRKEKGQDDVFAACSSKTKKKQWKQKKGPKVGPRKKPFKKDASKTEKGKEKVNDKG
ncbi:secreted RxLR effector protein 161-like [Pistacia vera]|uniref:secreted RxLR effector protein 161-like n=1 Tax=Pistacia vera TaxID=55513 RepID=UPI001262F2B9|nr:secreted RxLR effector protein 161-like [Pistacia vera]